MQERVGGGSQGYGRMTYLGRLAALQGGGAVRGEGTWFGGTEAQRGPRQLAGTGLERRLATARHRCPSRTIAAPSRGVRGARCVHRKGQAYVDTFELFKPPQ
jgi:hypothetical protein